MEGVGWGGEAGQPSVTRPLTSLKGDMVGPSKVALHFTGASSALSSCVGTGYSVGALRGFILRLPPPRRERPETLLKYTTSAVAFVEFAGGTRHPSPTCGDDALIVIADWVGALRARGEAVAHNGRYALSLYRGAMEIPFPITHPAVADAERIPRKRNLRQASAAP